MFYSTLDMIWLAQDEGQLSIHPKYDQSWVFIGRTDAKAETPVLWPPHEKSWLIGKDPDAGRYCGQEEKGTIEDEMAGWHHLLDGHEFGWTPGVGDGQRGLVCCVHGAAKSWTWLNEWTNWTAGWFMLRFDRKQQNSVKQLSFNKKLIINIMSLASIAMWIYLKFIWESHKLIQWARE